MKKRHRSRHSAIAAALVGSFLAGGVTGWLLRDKGPPLPIGAPIVEVMAKPDVALAAASRANPPTEHAVATTGEPTMTSRPAGGDDLRHRDLRDPIDGMDVGRLKGMFAESRGGGRAHEAVDILAPRQTPIHAVEDGSIAKLFYSQAGGNTIYQFDPSAQFAYYYAHLDRYADGIRDGRRVKRGDVIGYVGSSGNAPPDTPHLHFAIFQLGPERRWWKGVPIDPYNVFRP